MWLEPWLRQVLKNIPELNLPTSTAISSSVLFPLSFLHSILPYTNCTASATVSALTVILSKSSRNSLFLSYSCDEITAGTRPRRLVLF